MSGHTPGPWRLAKEPPACGITVTLYGYGPKTLGTIHTGSHEYMANARLIAAAPDLLEALKAQVAATTIALRNAGHTDADIADCTAQARAAIAKAEGE